MNHQKIRVGIIGVHPEKGWANFSHLPALKSLASDFEITAISNSSLEQAKLAAQKFNIPHALATSKELVNHPEVDLVVVTVRVVDHFKLVMEAIDAGKSVFSEWPLGATLAQAKEMAEYAKSKKVHTVVGLQTRVAPAIHSVRDLLKDQYVGKVLSTTLVGSGLIWGGTMEQKFQYTLDAKSGAAMLHVPFSHSLDAVLYALDTGFEDLSARLANSRKTTVIVETGETVPMHQADQVGVNGVLKNGAFISAHFRGGLSKGTNFYWEINGTEGDLIITSPVGYVGIGGFRVQGARGDQVALQDLPIPEKYGPAVSELGIAHQTSLLYRALANDLRAGSHFAPNFEDAFQLHKILAKIEEIGKKSEQ